jgi:hypothetical protein
LLCGVGVYRSQEAPEPPEPPEAPDVQLGDLQSQFFLSGGGTLGVALKDITPDQVRDLKLPGEYGAFVSDVVPDSPAAKAGVEKGDVIVGFAGERVHGVEQLRRLVRETPPGRTVSLEVIRNGQTRTLSAQLQPRRNQFHIQTPEIHVPRFPPYTFDFRGFTDPFGGGRPVLGISGEDLTPQLATFFGVAQGKGVLIREVTAGSPAAKAGLKAGDVVVAVEGKNVATVGELRQALEIKSGTTKRKFSLSLVRDHHPLTVAVELEKLAPAEIEKAAAETDLRARMAEAETALKEAQKHLSDQQRLLSEQALNAHMAEAKSALKEAQNHLSDQQLLLSDQMRKAVEQYQKATQDEQLRQLQKHLYQLDLARRSNVI